MHEKISSGNSTAISMSERKREYVLEDVFWVPAHSCSSGHSASSHGPEHYPERSDIGEAAGPSDLEINSTRKPIQARKPV